MRSYTDVMSIRNNVPSDIGPARLGVRWINEGPPVRCEIAVMPHRSEESPHHEVTLGETFPVGDETWRFADVDMKNADEWRVIVRRVDENEVMTPPTGHVWKSARLRPYGQLDDAQLQAVEAELGISLPPSYRDWLRDNNGAQPEVEHHVPGLPFTVLPERPLLGVHPQYPPFDLVHAQRVHRDPWLSPTWLVIANLSGGLLVLSLRPRDMAEEGVYFLPDAGLSGAIGPDGAAGRERHLVPVARSFGYFLGKLTPIDLSDLPPVQIIRPGEPGHSQHDDQPWSATRPEDQQR
ncbi:SMI1 / KNR4 family (SUKH-1) [Micromonospora citrea]|uniref:SMI1 / KNR4 family (SUKH-1) n=1 Tax=Micromonospora citrea TaxID=47855 RepID=A0A1C6USB9_9ACTN|nr:SMI1 / KNR4 family (SUKH-1) [Micromonospora citrea]